MHPHIVSELLHDTETHVENEVESKVLDGHWDAPAVHFILQENSSHSEEEKQICPGLSHRRLTLLNYRRGRCSFISRCSLSGMAIVSERHILSRSDIDFLIRATIYIGVRVAGWSDTIINSLSKLIGSISRYLVTRGMVEINPR
jgi:hypothetical protein